MTKTFWDYCEAQYKREVRAQEEEEIPSPPAFHLVVLLDMVSDLEELIDKGNEGAAREWLPAVAAYCRVFDDSFGEWTYKDGVWSTVLWGDTWAEVFFSTGDSVIILSLGAHIPGKLSIYREDDRTGDTQWMEDISPSELHRALRDYVDSEIEKYALPDEGGGT